MMNCSSFLRVSTLYPPDVLPRPSWLKASLGPGGINAQKSIIAHIITKRAHVEAKNVWRPHKQRLPLASLQNSTLHCPSYRHSHPCILDLALRLPLSSGCTPRSVQSFLPGHHWQFWLGSNHQAPRCAAKMLQQVEMQGSVSSSQGRLRQTESWKINLS